jgi:hypothetical protein
MVTLDTPCKEIKNIILSRNIKKIIIRSLGIDIIIYNQSNYWWGALPKQQQIITILPSASGDSETYKNNTIRICCKVRWIMYLDMEKELHKTKINTILRSL